MWSASSPEAWGALGWVVDEALCGGQLSDQGGARGPFMLQGQGRGALALLGGGNDSLDGGDGGYKRGRRRHSGRGDGAASVHMGLWVEKPGWEREEHHWVVGRMVGRGPRPKLNGGSSTGGRKPPMRQGFAGRFATALLGSGPAHTAATSVRPTGAARLAATTAASGRGAKPAGSAIGAGCGGRA